MPFHYLGEIATADVAVEAWGGSIEEMFRSAADGLLSVMVEEGTQLEEREEIPLELKNEELDLLLFSFLQELIFYKDARQLLLKPSTLEVQEGPEEYFMRAVIHGEKIDATRHSLLCDVKAVTLHRLQVTNENNRWSCTFVLDI